MDKVNGKLTVYFEGPFWVGAFEHEYKEGSCVLRIEVNATHVKQ